MSDTKFTEEELRSLRWDDEESSDLTAARARIAELEAELERERNRADYERTKVVELVAAGTDAGWNGVENSKLLPQFIRDLATRIAELEAKLIKEDEACLQLIRERDEAEDRLDEFAYMVAPVEVIGEHSNCNDPVQQAMELLVSHADAESMRSRITELERMVRDKDVQLHRLLNNEDIEGDHVHPWELQIRGLRDYKRRAAEALYSYYYEGTCSGKLVLQLLKEAKE